MPNIPFKCMAIFQSDAGYGWTETHYLNLDSGTNINSVLDTFNTTFNTIRRPLLGEDCFIVGNRVSYKTNVGIASLNRVYTTLQGTLGQPSGSQNDSIATQMVDVSGTRKKIIHLRGAWASVVQGDTYVPTNGPGWGVAFSKFQAGLISGGYGWYGYDPTKKVNGVITNYTQNGIDQVVFTVQVVAGSQPVASLIGPALPTTYECRVSKLNYSHSTLNRSFVVVPSSVTGPPLVTTLQTVGPVATGPFISNGFFRINPPTFVGYATAGPASLGERRMGKVLSHYPGRARRKAVI